MDKKLVNLKTEQFKTFQKERESKNEHSHQ